jgi:hypothetical protein
VEVVSISSYEAKPWSQEEETSFSSSYSSETDEPPSGLSNESSYRELRQVIPAQGRQGGLSDLILQKVVDKINAFLKAHPKLLRERIVFQSKQMLVNAFPGENQAPLFRLIFQEGRKGGKKNVKQMITFFPSTARVVCKALFCPIEGLEYEKRSFGELMGHEHRIAKQVYTPYGRTASPMASISVGNQMLHTGEWYEYDLKQVIFRGILSVGERMQVAKGVADGLAQIHQRGVVHNDLKPENILVRRDGVSGLYEVALTDFDVSIELETERKTPSQFISSGGTAGYNAPELIYHHGRGLGLVFLHLHSTPGSERRELPADPRQDLWSLGVVLYMLFTQSLTFPMTSGLAGVAGGHESALLRRSMSSYKRPTSGLLSSYRMKKKQGKIEAGLNKKISDRFVEREVPIMVLELLKGLLSFNPVLRPSAKEVSQALGLQLLT